MVREKSGIISPKSYATTIEHKDFGPELSQLW